jgi:hypothetical protein
MASIKEIMKMKAAKKAPVVEEVEEVEVEVAEEEEVVVPKKIIKKPAAKPVEVEEVDDDDEVDNDADDDQEPEEAPKPKGRPGRKPAAKPVEVEEVDDDQEPEEAPKQKGRPGRKPAAKPVEVEDESDQEPEDVPAPKKRASPAWGGSKEKEKRELRPGAWMPQDEFLSRFHARLGEKMGENAPNTKAVTVAVIKEFEAFMKETLSEYDVKFIEKFKRREMEARVYAPNTELAQVATKYHTLVSPHTKVSLNLYFGKTMTKGTDVDGTFVEGKFDEKGKFTPGTWSVNEDGEEIFSPKKTKK